MRTLRTVCLISVAIVCLLTGARSGGAKTWDEVLYVAKDLTGLRYLRGGSTTFGTVRNSPLHRGCLRGQREQAVGVFFPNRGCFFNLEMRMFILISLLDCRAFERRPDRGVPAGRECQTGPGMDAAVHTDLSLLRSPYGSGLVLQITYRGSGRRYRGVDRRHLHCRPWRLPARQPRPPGLPPWARRWRRRTAWVARAALMPPAGHGGPVQMWMTTACCTPIPPPE